MGDAFITVFSTMMGLMLCLAVGYILRRFRLEPDNTPTVLSKLELYVFMPSMVLSSFIKNCTIESLQQHADLFLYGLMAAVLSLIFGRLLGRFFSKEEYERRIYTYALTVANFGYVGMPLVVSLFGSEGLYAFNIFCVPLNILTYGIMVPSLIPAGKENAKGSWWKRLLNPVTVVMLVGLILGMTGWKDFLPGFVLNTVDGLSSCVGPVAMILTGFVIGGFNVSELLKIKRVYVVSIFRLLVLPMVLVGLIWLCGAGKNACVLCMIAYSSALGLNTVVIPATYGGDTHTGASMALISSLGCAITIPLLYAFLNMIL